MIAFFFAGPTHCKEIFLSALCSHGNSTWIIKHFFLALDLTLFHQQKAELFENLVNCWSQQRSGKKWKWRKVVQKLWLFRLKFRKFFKRKSLRTLRLMKQKLSCSRSFLFNILFAKKWYIFWNMYKYFEIQTTTLKSIWSKKVSEYKLLMANKNYSIHYWAIWVPTS